MQKVLGFRRVLVHEAPDTASHQADGLDDFPALVLTAPSQIHVNCCDST